MSSNGAYYLSDLIMSEEIFKEVTEIIEPYIPANLAGTRVGDIKVIMGTIEGDIHDLGKNIVSYMLRSAGYQVYDLGVNVPPEKFIEAIKETGAAILGVCVLLTYCIGSIKKMITLLNENGLKDRAIVILGGYPVNDAIREYTGADYCTNRLPSIFELFQFYEERVLVFLEFSLVFALLLNIEMLQEAFGKNLGFFHIETTFVCLFDSDGLAAFVVSKLQAICRQEDSRLLIQNN